MVTEKQLDTLFQQYACKQLSAISYAKAQVGHHIVGRANKMLRWDIRNCLPLTHEEHQMLHAGKITWRPDLDLSEYLINTGNIQLKDYLVQNGLSMQDFMNNKQKDLEEAINLY